MGRPINLTFQADFLAHLGDLGGFKSGKWLRAICQNPAGPFAVHSARLLVIIVAANLVASARGISCCDSFWSGATDPRLRSPRKPDSRFESDECKVQVCISCQSVATQVMQPNMSPRKYLHRLITIPFGQAVSPAVVGACPAITREGPSHGPLVRH